ncbi:MAG: phosphoribosylanthranilate isomerase, partial [Bacteroidota bacterium]
MIIKVCGIKSSENIAFLSKADINMVGLNFYKPSVRDISNDVEPEIFDAFPPSVKRVGIFVNEDPETVYRKSKEFKLDFAQLHGDEPVEYCYEVAMHVPIIKVFRIDENFDFKGIDKFTMASYYLFDTHTRNYGGSGKKFNWENLFNYDGQLPFLLSGGIGPHDYETILELSHPQFVGIDI